MAGRDETWVERQAAIREILNSEEIRNQAQLIARLQSRGFIVTQSSVSRDLAELRVAKLEGRYVPAELLAPKPSATDALREAAASLLSIREAGPYLLVLHTPPGRAQIVGVAIDSEAWPEVAGTVAGDDTVLVALPGRREQLRIRQRLQSLIEETAHV
jgi:transcriptional regulator of arginine metabolism